MDAFFNFLLQQFHPLPELLPVFPGKQKNKTHFLISGINFLVIIHLIF